IDVSHLGEPAEADQLLAPLRALRPVTDTVQVIPARAVGHLHLDPEMPVPSVGDGLMLASLPVDAVETLIRVIGTGTGPPLVLAELRHLGGELRHARPGSGALAAIDAGYALFTAGPVAFSQTASAAARSVAAVQAAMSPWSARQMYLNLAETAR